MKYTFVLFTFFIISLSVYFLFYKKELKYRLQSFKTNQSEKNIVQIEKIKYVTEKEYLSVERLKKENKYNYTIYDLNDCSEYIYKNYNITDIEKYYNMKNRDKVLYCKNKLISNDYNIFYDFNNIELITNLVEIKEETKAKWNKKSLEYNLNFYKKSKQKLQDKDINIVLLIRSYRRPEYLKQCLDSLKEVDLNFFYQKIILDDNSQDENLISLYDEFINLGFQVKVNLENEKQNSFVSCLDLLSDKNKYILYLDNDMIVKKDFHLQILNTYFKIKSELNLADNKILLSGFDYQKKHKVIKKYQNYNEKKTIGGANMLFHYSLVKNFQKWWLINKDWGVCENLIKSGGRIFTTKKSYTQHIGMKGDHSNILGYNKSDNYD